VRTRSGRNVTGSLPALAGIAEQVPDGTCSTRLEGLVGKRVDSRYEPGKRSRMWLKLKCEDWREHHALLRHQR
jgi:ATP-dependent DNA ligase